MGRDRAEDEHRCGSRVSVRTRFAAAALVLVAVPFALLLALVQAGWVPLRDADLDAASDLHGYAVTHSAFVTAMRTLSIIGSYRVWTPVFTALAVWLFWRRQPRLALFVAVTAIGSSLLNNLVKRLVDRARPILPQPVSAAHGFGFPSGHAQAAVVGYGILLVIFLPMLHGAVRVVAVCGAVLMIAAIGFSRIALGVHYLSDVLAGYLLGAAWLAAMIAAFDIGRVKPRQRSHSRTVTGR
jgi:membrane-associated phospholipid phosphatase